MKHPIKIANKKILKNCFLGYKNAQKKIKINSRELINYINYIMITVIFLENQVKTNFI